MRRYVVASVLILTAIATKVHANPISVTLAGSFQSELGCAADWDPACLATALAYDANDNVWQRSFLLPAGTWEYKAALNGSWTENYGANAIPNGANIAFSLAGPTLVSFFYSDTTHWITDDVNSIIATAPGSFQSEIGCSGDWDPGCLRSWLQDPDGDGIYTFLVLLPLGNYETKVAIDQDWSENYGLGGVPGGPNIPFSVGSGSLGSLFQYNAATHVLTVQDLQTAAPVPEPSSILLVGAGLALAMRRLAMSRRLSRFRGGSFPTTRRSPHRQ
jgi:Pullulanase X25 domain/PEP-CTERM motif